MGHNLATDIVTVILIGLSTVAVAVPVTIGFVLEYQKRRDAKLAAKAIKENNN